MAGMCLAFIIPYSMPVEKLHLWPKDATIYVSIQDFCTGLEERSVLYALSTGPALQISLR